MHTIIRKSLLTPAYRTGRSLYQREELPLFGKEGRGEIFSSKVYSIMRPLIWRNCLDSCPGVRSFFSVWPLAWPRIGLRIFLKSFPCSSVGSWSVLLTGSISSCTVRPGSSWYSRLFCMSQTKDQLPPEIQHCESSVVTSDFDRNEDSPPQADGVS